MNTEGNSSNLEVVAFQNNTTLELIIEEPSLANSAVELPPGTNGVSPEPYLLPGGRDGAISLSVSLGRGEEIVFINELLVWIEEEGASVYLHFEAINETANDQGNFELHPEFQYYRLNLAQTVAGGLVIIGTLDGLVDEELAAIPQAGTNG